LDGIKSETPRIVNEFYKKYDDEFPAAESIQSRFLEIIDAITKIYDRGYVLTYFNRPRYFYTLFVCFDKALTEKDRVLDYDKIIENLSKLETALNETTDSIIKEAARIKELHFIRTTNMRERIERVGLVYEVVFSA